MASKITKEERKALKWVRDALAKRNNLKPDKYGIIDADRCLNNNVIPPALFNMTTTCTHGSCGTVGCIGWWMGLKMFAGSWISAHNYVSREHSEALYDLFYEFDVRRSNLTRSDAVKAIDRVLARKYKMPWHAVFEKRA